MARDGSPVAVYLALPVEGEPDLVAGVTTAGGSVLELGCGAGRVTHALVARGFDLVGVDDSEAMLAEIHGADCGWSSGSTTIAPGRISSRGDRPHGIDVTPAM